MANTKTMLMSAGGNTYCEISIAHAKVHAVAWVEVTPDNKYLACGMCADEAEDAGFTLLRDVRTGHQITCTWCDNGYDLEAQLGCAYCGDTYDRSAYHNCRNVAGEPWIVQCDEGR